MSGTVSAPAGSLGARLLRRAVLARLAHVTNGRIVVVEGNTETRLGPVDADLVARLTVHDPRFYRDVALDGSLGAASAYADGYWSVDDLTALIRIVARNADVNRRLETGVARLTRPFARLYHWSRQNRREQSRKNIAAHYDLGNDFFSCFLDETMMYSCAIFPHASATLADASRHKNDHICRKLHLTPGDEILEIGGGWGAFAIHAASTYGCRVVTTTISAEQFAMASERVRNAGLEDRIEVVRYDYRDLPAKLGRQFDKIVSIEMIEAVGEKYLPEYFRVCSELLRPKGAMALQAIVIADHQYDLYRRSVDFIQRYIFPGSFLPSLGAIRQTVARATDLEIFHLEDITAHYVPTLRRWREAFHRSREQLETMGFGETFQRLWDFYFCYCEGGFAEKTIGDVQVILTKPDYDGPLTASV